ncbi:MAG TPA: hypothetical protein VIJ14_00605 [Rhabdochlamydiaceae bacterium]
MTGQRDVTVSLGYVGDNTEKDRATDFTEILEFREIVVKSWTNEDKTVLKSVAVFSKYGIPFQLTVEMNSKPPLDESINQKYIDALAGLCPIADTYALLVQNPYEYPMVQEVEITKRFGRARITPENGLVDLRREIIHRVQSPFINGKV